KNIVSAPKRGKSFAHQPNNFTDKGRILKKAATQHVLLKIKILIVEDQFIEAKSLNLILSNAGYSTCTVARSVQAALSIIEKEKPDLVLVDIFLQGEETGIDLGKILNERNMAFVY